MADSKKITVFVSTDGGLKWLRYGVEEGKIRRESNGPGVVAVSPLAAINLVREEFPELKTNDEALYMTQTNFRPKKQILQLVERRVIGFADEDASEAQTQKLPGVGS